MILRKLIPGALVVLAAGTGCQHHAAAAPQETIAQAPAPFATPPVLAGTPGHRHARGEGPSCRREHHDGARGQDAARAIGFPDFGDLFPFFHQGPGPDDIPGGEGRRRR